MLIHTTDQVGRQLVLPDYPKRIISLVPSQTEYLFDLGLAVSIVGITRFCIHPQNLAANTEKIGGTKQLYIEKIAALQPDLIIANKEENNREDIEQLQTFCPVWVSDVNSFEDALRMMQELGRITNRTQIVQEMIDNIEQRFAEWNKVLFPKKSCAYFIWRKPYMVAANDTFIHQMLLIFGLRNVFEHHSRYPEVTTEQIADLAPDYIFLSSEPYAFDEKHIEEFQAMVPKAKVMIVDGEMFSWYGSRLSLVPDYFAEIRNGL